MTAPRFDEDGSLSLKTSNDTDSAAAADGSAVSSDIGIGAAIAINTVTVVNKATLDGHVEAKGVTLEAVMANDGDSENEKTHKSVVTSVAGAGGTKVGVAGSGAINVAVVDTGALITSGSYVDAGDGDVSIKAENRTHSRVSATASAAVSDGDSESTSTGVGASFALNVGVHSARAEVKDWAVLLKMNKLGDTR